MDQELIKRIVEATLLAASQPLGVSQLAAVFDEERPPPPGSIPQALADLAAESASRGVELIEVASGYRYQVRTELYPWVSRLWSEKPPRYSRALLETLALIAYRQPITRGEIEQIRGVAVNSQIVRTLEEREWIRVVGHRDVPGKPALFGTTRGFLDYFNLKSLDQLPTLAELQEIAELDPELDFNGTRPVALPAVADGTEAEQSPTEETTAAAAGDEPDLRAQPSGDGTVEPVVDAADDGKPASVATAGDLHQQLDDDIGGSMAAVAGQNDSGDGGTAGSDHDNSDRDSAQAFERYTTTLFPNADADASASTDNESTPEDVDPEDPAPEQNV